MLMCYHEIKKTWQCVDINFSISCVRPHKSAVYDVTGVGDEKMWMCEKSQQFKISDYSYEFK